MDATTVYNIYYGDPYEGMTNENIALALAQETYGDDSVTYSIANTISDTEYIVQVSYNAETLCFYQVNTQTRMVKEY